jgi:hypothetical protein
MRIKIKFNMKWESNKKPISDFQKKFQSHESNKYTSKQ